MLECLPLCISPTKYAHVCVFQVVPDALVSSRSSSNAPSPSARPATRRPCIASTLTVNFTSRCSISSTCSRYRYKSATSKFKVFVMKKVCRQRIWMFSSHSLRRKRLRFWDEKNKLWKSHKLSTKFFISIFVIRFKKRWTSMPHWRTAWLRRNKLATTSWSPPSIERWATTSTPSSLSTKSLKDCSLSRRQDSEGTTKRRKINEEVLTWKIFLECSTSKKTLI